jgi:hypothetical protein
MTQDTIPAMLRDLDDGRLIAQHREACGLLAFAAKTQKVNNLSRMFMNHQIHLVDVHDLAVKEMERRGFWGHSTPLDPYSYPYYAPGTPFVPTEEQIMFDRKDLCTRYVKHSEEVLSGIRKGLSDYLRWTKTSLPDWLTWEALDAIEKEIEFVKKRLESNI